ncbi:MAG: F0F1 ATP synthase subunit B [Myxococcales bacterium]|nr:F0F1 ATP synthase subunit B [Myxococcales bacterium]
MISRARSLCCLLLLLWTTPAFASGGLTLGSLAFHLVNLIILLALLIKFARKPVARGLADRADRIEKDIAEATRLHGEARAMLTEYEGKLAGLEKQADELLAQYRADGEAEKQRIIAEAEAEAERIKREAERTAENEVARARTRLEAEVIDLAIAAAEKAIRAQVGPLEHRRLTEEYFGKLEETLGA